MLRSGVRKRVVSKSVVLADVPLYRNFLLKVFPCGATLAKKAMIFDIPGPQKTGTRAHSPKPPFYKTALWFPLDSWVLQTLAQTCLLA